MITPLSELIDRINQTLSAESVLFLVGYKTNGVEQKGSTLRSFCPIHKEEMIRSLVVDTARGTFRCTYSGCAGSRGGRFFDLYRLAKGLDDESAARALVRELGLKLDASLYEGGSGLAAEARVENGVPSPAVAGPDANLELAGLAERLEQLAAAAREQETLLRAHLAEALESICLRVEEWERREREAGERLTQLERTLAQANQELARALSLLEALPGLRERLDGLAAALRGAAPREALAELAERLSGATTALEAKLQSIETAAVPRQEWQTQSVRLEELAQQLHSLNEARAEADGARRELAERLGALEEAASFLRAADAGAGLISGNLGGILRRLEETWARLERTDQELFALARQVERKPSGGPTSTAASPESSDPAADRIALL